MGSANVPLDSHHSRVSIITGDYSSSKDFASSTGKARTGLGGERSSTRGQQSWKQPSTHHRGSLSLPGWDAWPCMGLVLHHT